MTDPQPAHDIEAVFRQKGIPFTRQRRQIWDFFAGADRAATITEAADALRGDGVGQATVYRTVQLLSDLGLLARVQDGPRRDLLHRAAHRPQPPAHLRRLPRGWCASTATATSPSSRRRLAEATGFTIYGHHLEVYGICPACRAAKEGDHGE